LVEISVAPLSLNSSSTLSMTTDDVSTNSADVPGVTWSRTLRMKSSSMPTSAMEPDRAPMAAPTAMPSSGTKKMSPNKRPQKLPPRAPALFRLCNCSVFGFFLPSAQYT